MVEEDDGGWGGGRRRTEEGGVERVFWRPRSTNGEKRGREEGGEPCSQGALVSNARKFTNLAPVSNFYYITTTLVGWG